MGEGLWRAEGGRTLRRDWRICLYLQGCKRGGRHLRANKPKGKQTEESAVCGGQVGEGGAHDGRQDGGVSPVPRSHNRHVGIRRVAEWSCVRAQNVEHGAALLRMRFRHKPGLKRGLSGATLQLPQTALERGNQVWIAELSDGNHVVASSGAEGVLLQHELCILGASGCLIEVSGRVGSERRVAGPQRRVARCGWGGRQRLVAGDPR